MGPLQRIEFYKALKAHAAAPTTAPADAANITAMMGVGRANRHARRAFEAQAAHIITQHATAAGVTESELIEAEQADFGGILPAGWLQALLAALPTILTIIAQILAMFGIKPTPVPVPPAPTPIPPVPLP